VILGSILGDARIVGGPFDRALLISHRPDRASYVWWKYDRLGALGAAQVGGAVADRAEQVQFRWRGGSVFERQPTGQGGGVEGEGIADAKRRAGGERVPGPPAASGQSECHQGAAGVQDQGRQQEGEGAPAQAETATLLRAKRDPSPALAIAAGPATVTVRTLSALPPDPTALDLEIPHTATTVRVAADRITTGLRAALAIAGTDPHAIVQLHGRRAHLDIHVTAGANRASATVALDHASGPAADVTLHARPLVAVLAPLGTAEVTLGLRGPGGPVSIAATEGSVRYRGLLAVTVDSGRPGRPVAATAGA